MAANRSIPFTWLAITVTAGILLAGCTLRTPPQSGHASRSDENSPIAAALTPQTSRTSPETAAPPVPAPPVAVVEPAPAPARRADARVPAASPSALAVDAGLPAYEPRVQLRGRMRAVGSDTMDRLMTHWEELFIKFHPGLDIRHEGKGSSTAPPALQEGLSDFGPMSRPLKESEIKSFYTRFGHPPMAVPVAVDALAVYVHPSNPIAKRGLSLQELDAIFSSSRKRGHDQDVTTWGQLGLTGEWANARIVVYSRNAASGTYGFFKDHALSGGDFKTNNREMVGSAAVVAGVASDRFAIGYSGIGYKNDRVATVPLSVKPGESTFAADANHAYSGEYPLARFLYVVINYKPGTPLPDLQREYLSLIFSRQGQEMVVKEGFYPVSADKAQQELAKLGGR